ncbi:MAG: carboxypeptidase regulatory-like domain-containing protein [Sedimentisphaerales bacterium]|jgi:hypothetical protein
MKKIILCIIISLFNLPASALDYNDFPPALQQILDQRTADLNSNEDIYIAGRVTMSDGARIRSGEDVMVNLHQNIDEPLWVYEDGWFMMDRPFPSRSIGSSGKLVLRAFGYEPNDMFIRLLKGGITYVEFVMHKIPSEKLASVGGIVTDDQNRPLAGARVHLSFPYANHGYSGDIGYTCPHMEMTTGPDGQYSFEGLSVTTHDIVASVLGYAYHQISFTPPAGETVTKDLKLYPNRSIVIDYVYQADGNRSFTSGNLQTGTIEWVNGNEGVDFSDGKVKGYGPQPPRDIEMMQDQDKLNFQIFYANGKNGFYDAGDVDFGAVTEAAQTGYSTDRKPCVIGHTYVVRTYENNYAKFVVKSISGSE